MQLKICISPNTCLYSLTEYWNFTLEQTPKIQDLWSKEIYLKFNISYYYSRRKCTSFLRIYTAPNAKYYIYLFIKINQRIITTYILPAHLNAPHFRAQQRDILRTPFQMSHQISLPPNPECRPERASTDRNQKANSQFY